jgi:hypothetical protein
MLTVITVVGHPLISAVDRAIKIRIAVVGELDDHIAGGDCKGVECRDIQISLGGADLDVAQRLETTRIVQGRCAVNRRRFGVTPQ